MPLVIFEAGAILVMAKYIEQKTANGVWYFRRRVPHDVQKHYPKLNKRGELYFSLQTKDRSEAAAVSHRKATEQDGFWKSVRSGEVMAGPEVISAAIALLDSYGLRPGQSVEYTDDEIQVEKFLDRLRIEAGILGSEDQRENWQKDLPLVQQQAADLFFGEKPPLFLSEGLQKYFELTGEDPTKRQGIGRTRVVNYFISVCGDLPIDRYIRSHANDFLRFLLEERGNKTDTVTRRLNDIRPVFSTLCREYELQDREIFKSVIIPNKGKDRKVKLPYTNDEVRLIQRACIDKDDDIRWIVAILSDTGMRMSEAVAIRVEDVFLEDQYPYLALKEYEGRTLKTDPSTPTGRLMLTVLGGIAEFERGIMLERQREGIAKAKADGKYKGRKPTARAKADDVLKLRSEGVGPSEIAHRLGIGRASVYRIMSSQKKQLP